AFSEDGHTPDRFDQIMRTYGGMDGSVLWEERTDFGVVTVDKERRSPSAPTLESDEITVLTQCDAKFTGAAQSLCDFVECFGLDQRGGGDPRGTWLPADFTHGQSISIGGKEGDQIVLNLHLDAGKDRQGVVFRSSNDHLCHGFREGSTVDNTGQRGQYG